MILSVTLNPSVDHQLFLDRLLVHDTNRVKHSEVDAGGKGVNLSRVFAELGGETVATGFLGGGAGAYVCRVLELQGCRNQFVDVQGETRTNFSVEDGTEAPPTTFNERGPNIHEQEFEKLLEKVRELAPSASWVCMGGSLPPGVPVDSFKIIGEIAKGLGAKVLLDADGEAQVEGLKAMPDFIKPNAKEASRLVGRSVETLEDALSAAQQLYCRLNKPLVVISRGEDGAVLVSSEGSFVGRSAPVEARSTIGSGDSFLGGMLWALEEGRGLEESFRWGLAAGAATATTSGSEIARCGVCHVLFNHTSVERLA